jgi:hypothetical protein
MRAGIANNFYKKSDEIKQLVVWELYKFTKNNIFAT